MPSCRFSFTHNGRQICVLEQKCAFNSTEEQQTCQKVNEYYDTLTVEEIKDRKKKLLHKLESYSNLHQSKEKLKNLKII